MTLSAVPSTVATVDVIELEPEVVAANRAVPSARAATRSPIRASRCGSATHAAR
jgi:hypothetical protein